MSPLINHNLFINFSLLAWHVRWPGAVAKFKREGGLSARMFYKQVKCVQNCMAMAYLCPKQSTDIEMGSLGGRDSNSNMTSQLINENIPTQNQRHHLAN